MVDSTHIQKCKAEIEQRLRWGPSDQWTNQDFILLSEEIFNKTGINLSLTTLKRIWGKVEYQSHPSISTLNVLARYLDYAHWRAFQNNHSTTNQNVSKSQVAKASTSFSKYVNQKVLVIVVVLIALSSLYFFIDRRQVFYNPDDVIFKSKKVTDGLPNTVIFEYDVSKVVADSFHIQQSWDRRRRVRISPHENTHTSFYYYPGYFHAKLIANSEVIKEHEIFVDSKGWIGMIERFPEPIYVNDILSVASGILTVDPVNLPSAVDNFHDKDFWVDYYFVRDLGETDAANFIYECRIRNGSDMGSVCHESRISLICTKGRFNIPICMPGCVSNLFVTLGDRFLSGKKHDLSALGCDVNKWTDFKLVVRNKTCEVFINDEIRLKEMYEGDVGRVVGLKFKFNGIGEVDKVSLRDLNGSIVVEDQFEYVP